ncbi:MAG TPA: hypothetical protein VF942_11290 [Acidimicrobiales bacterium]
MKVSVGKMVATAAVAGAVGLGGAGIASWTSAGSAASPVALVADTATTVPGASGPVKAGHGGHGLVGLLRRADHGTFEVKNKAGQWVTYTFDKGKVTSVNAQSITLARPDGKSATLNITPDTKFRGVASAADVQTGKGAIVISNSSDNALVVAQRDRSAHPAQPAQDSPAQPAQPSAN